MNASYKHEASTKGVDKETRLIQKVALYAFLLNLGLATMKGILAFYSSSLAVTAGAIDSGIDAVASLLLLGGLKLSTKKTPSFPLGLYKIENVISVVVALSIFFAGYEIAREVLTRESGRPQISGIVVALLLAGVLAIFLFGRYALAVGRRTGSPTLIAEGRHRQVDVLSSMVVLVSVSIGYAGWEFSFLGVSIDQIAAALVVIFIAQAGWKLLSDGMRVLLDASVDFETLALVRRIVEQHPLVAGVASLTGRSAGRFRFLQVNVLLRTDDLKIAHQTSEALESMIHKEVPHVEGVMIHYEPLSKTRIRIAVPLIDSSGGVSSHFGESPYFTFLTIRLSDERIEEKILEENPYKGVETAKGIRVAEWLAGRNVDIVLMKEDLSRKGPGYVLSNAGVQTIVTSAGNLDEAVAEALPAHRGRPGEEVLEKSKADMEVT